MRPHSEAGFTLLEVILALVLTGLLAAMAGTGVVSGFNVFMAARDNAHITQKANLALTRLTRELREATNVAGYNSGTPWLIYDGPQGRRAVARDTDTIKLYNLPGNTTILTAGEISSGGDILIDGVNGVTGFTLNCFDGSSAWTTAQSVRRLSTIAFQLTIDRDSLGGRASTFQNTVHLRNNNNYGGALLAVTPPTPPTQLDYCFINTVQEDRAAFPLLILLALLFLPLTALHRQRAARQQRPRLHDTKGAALLMVIVVLVVFSALAIVMLPMITTSQYTQLNQDTASKTYYLAESGYRYAASQYLNAHSEIAKNSVLENLHGQPQPFTLAGSAGSFQLEVFPYYGYIRTNPSGATTLTIRVPGGVTGDLDATAFSAGGRLQIGTTIFSYNNASVSSPDISFNMTAAMPSVSVNTDVFWVARTHGAAQTVTQGGLIDMAAGSTRTFPLQNAEVVINDNVYAYRTNDRVNSQLIGISDPEVANMAALDLNADTDVVLSKFVDLQSTGSYGSGSLAGQRRLTYHVPLPNVEHSRRRIEFHDTFDDLDHWNTIWGGQALQTIGDNNALVLNDPQWVTTLPRVSLTALDWATTEIDLEEIHQKADYYLSYDAQVKIGYLGTPIPDEPSARPFTPAVSSIPTYFAGGLNFRLDSTAASHNTYGLSFLRGLNSAPHDRLDDNIVAAEEIPIIVLWQQTNSGNIRNWLAWKQIGDLEVFSEDVEAGVNGWTTGLPWAISSIRAHGGAQSWHFARDGVNSDALVSPEVSECDYDYLHLSYHSWHAKAADDILSVEFRTHNGVVWSGWSEIDRIDAPDSGGDWDRREVVVDVETGAPAQFRFSYATDTADTSSYTGWFIDDIRIGGDLPLQEATLALRLQEAPSLRFTNGGTYTLTPGDAIYQAAASATVDADPVITSGAWAGGNATGHLVLKDLSGTFTLNQPFSVIGGGQVGMVREVRDRDNFIRVYYGSPTGCGTENTNPLDNEKLANPRDPTELAWPPADGDPYTAEEDAFTLIQWDAGNINTGVSSFSRLTATQLRSNALITPNSLLGNSRPEIGLHAMGRGAENIYFDDFGLSVVSNDHPADVTAPIQE